MHNNLVQVIKDYAELSYAYYDMYFTSHETKAMEI